MTVETAMEAVFWGNYGRVIVKPTERIIQCVAQCTSWYDVYPVHNVVHYYGFIAFRVLYVDFGVKLYATSPSSCLEFMGIH